MAMEVKQKKCRNPNCEKLFKPFTTTQKFCSAECTREGKKVQENARESKKKDKSEANRKMLFEIARMTFNAYIRERDKRKPCICCGNPLGDSYHAGHFFSGGGHAAVIFDEDNVHAQRADCNTGHRAGMLADYSIMLLGRIGVTNFELLKSKAYETKKWEVSELQLIIREYKQKLKDLKR